MMQRIGTLSWRMQPDREDGGAWPERDGEHARPENKAGASLPMEMGGSLNRSRLEWLEREKAGMLGLSRERERMWLGVRVYSERELERGGPEQENLLGSIQ